MLLLLYGSNAERTRLELVTFNRQRRKEIVGNHAGLGTHLVIDEQHKNLRVTLYILVWIQWRKNTSLELVTFNRQRQKEIGPMPWQQFFRLFPWFVEAANIFMTKVCPTMILTICIGRGTFLFYRTCRSAVFHFI